MDFFVVDVLVVFVVVCWLLLVVGRCWLLLVVCLMVFFVVNALSMILLWCLCLSAK